MRGYIPPINDAERIFCKRVQDVVDVACRGKAIRFLPFLNDREQLLASAVFSKQKHTSFFMFGGYDSAQRKMVAVGSEDSYEDSYIEQQDFPIIALEVKANTAKDFPNHRDFLGALMALRISRENLGDIIINEDEGKAIIFAQNRVCNILENELVQVGRVNVSVNTVNNLLQFANLQPFQSIEKTVTISSLRLDAAVAAFTKLSRGKASELITAKRVEINHVPTVNCHDKIYEQDVFTIKGIGKFKLCTIGNLSKKGKIYITYLTYK